MAEYVEVVGGPSPNLVESGNLTATGQSPWMALRGQAEHGFTCSVQAVASPLGTFLVEARLVRGDGTFGEVVTVFGPSTDLADFPQSGRLAGNWDVRLRCSAYSSGTYNLAITR